MDEPTILKHCRLGELELLDELVHLHADSLYRFCYHLSGNADGAAELFQDTWVKALRNFHRCKAEDTILGWLFCIAANLHRDKYRRQSRWLRVLSRQRDIPSSVGPDEMLLDDELCTVVRNAVNDLADSYRIPLVLYYFDDYSIEKIAKFLGIPEGTVKSRLHRAKQRLKSLLEVLL